MAIAGVLLVGCTSFATSVHAQSQGSGSIPNVLVMGEDCDQDTVPRNSRVFRQVLQEMQQQLDTGGHRYFVETTVGSAKWSRTGRGAAARSWSTLLGW